MSKKFDEEVESLKLRVAEMGDLAREMVHSAIQSLTDRDLSAIRLVNSLEQRVDRGQVEVDDEVVRLMTVFGPVALDLRFVLMTTRINTEIERIADQAVNMCENVQLLLREPPLKEIVDLPRMADVAGGMVRDSLRAYQDFDSALARTVIRTDGEVDALNDRVFRELLDSMSQAPEKITPCVALILIARSLERIADHATNIAEEVIYMVKGEDIRHRDAMET